MRSLHRNYRDLYYATVISEETIKDEYGNDTLETLRTYSDPTLLQANVSANAGQDVVNVFGSITEYSRTVTYTGAICPLEEGCRVWFGVSIEKPHNYTVVKVADSKNGYLIALREVSDRG